MRCVPPAELEARDETLSVLQPASLPVLLATANPPLVLQGQTFLPGDEGDATISLGRSLAHSEVTVPVHVIRSLNPGPCLVVMAGIHGDEINGIAIVRRLLGLRSSLKLACGTLLAVPVANIPAFHF